MLIRSLVETDRPQYLALLCQLSNYTFNGKNPIDLDNRIVHIIEQDGVIIAAASLFIMRKIHCNPFGQIEDVVVKKEFRGQGLGKRMIEHMTSLAKEQGCYKVVLNTLDHNVGFYESCGFVPAGSQFKITF